MRFTQNLISVCAVFIFSPNAFTLKFPGLFESLVSVGSLFDKRSTSWLHYLALQNTGLRQKSRDMFFILGPSIVGRTIWEDVIQC
jgi:hypothetical protein